MVRVKICGITNLKDAISAIEYGADEIGFNFFPMSKRSISPKEARKIVNMLPSNIQKVGVFVNAPIHFISDQISFVGLDSIQLHGDESSNYLAILRQKTDKKIIRAIRIASNTKLTSIICSEADYVLLDTASTGSYGGSGKSFDWAIADRATELFPYLYLAGGLTTENVVRAIRTVRPYAVDVASGVESSPGMKDTEKMKTFIQKAKNA
ncbi:phosphoribosylanthranilate isomerase [Leptolyngbya sp. 7M]|uniref:phosphoribosylanthranilate isomerase n=1 Tax=Leptolyngbya sp. 7M TaxID=2812896 RepID=UPI001B8B2DCD|nr:phosphoribosylanthranilate isomerase [Leptolyngbya sp. 7M]QYO65492.1 phosphoribosylanthranilate isomerase [Leptolyngbya sp. 7M]